MSSRCARHPEVETNLRCNQCDTLICPRCLVHTPVGAKCPACAKVRRLPTYHLTPVFYLRAVGAGLAVAAGGGFAWAFLLSEVRFPYLNFIIALGLGYAAGEAVSLATNRKRGLPLQVIAGVALALAYLTSSLLLNARFSLDLFDLIALALGIMLAVGRLR